MGTFNFHPDHNTPHKAVFCLWDDFDEYKEDIKEEYGEDSKEYRRELSDYAYGDWCEYEQDYFGEMLKEDLKTAFGYPVDVDFSREEICSVGHTWNFAGMNFCTSVGIRLEVGYYAGFALDWEVKCVLDSYCEEIPDRETAIWYLRDGVNEGLAVALADKFIKRCERELASITDKLDKILMELAPHNMEIGWCCSEYKQ